MEKQLVVVKNINGTDMAGYPEQYII